MQKQMQAETLIVRNEQNKMLYDLVNVNYFTESKEYLYKGLTFDQAVEIKKEYQEFDEAI